MMLVVNAILPEYNKIFDLPNVYRHVLSYPKSASDSNIRVFQKYSLIR